jgi:serine/threonine-protein kinase
MHQHIAGLAPAQGQFASSHELNGRYRLDEIIGSGATATIWRAWDRRLDRAVAVKVLDGTGLGGDANERARFRDEARTLARLSHPNIVAVFDSGMENGVAYVVMELVEGRSVVWRLADGVIPVAEAATVMAQVCDALAAAHAAGVVHRDIKPGNILLGPGRTVKVCDFGIARLLDATALTATHVAVGTSSYMSPEQVAGRPLDGRADLYAVGCVLFRMLTGTAPFVGDSAFNVAYQQLHNQPPTVRSRRADIPEELDRLVGRLLAKDPARRPVTAAEVRVELLRWSDPVTAAVATAAARRRRPFVRVGVATMAALAVPGALLVAWPDQEPAQPPAAAVSPASSATASASTSASASPSVSPAKVATSKMATAPTPQPEPSPSPLPRSVLDQIMDLKALVRQLEATGQLPPSNADDLDHMLNDLTNLVIQDKQREAHDKLAAIQKKNDDLLAAGKISPAGHAAFEDGLDRLAVAISNMPKA